jgi:hypothetical protein
MDEMRGNRIARKGRSIEKKNPVTSARQKHRRRRTGTARAYDYDIVRVGH